MAKAKPTVSKLKKKADEAWSLYIRYRDAEFVRGEWIADCFTCGNPFPVKQIQCGHFVSRKVSSLRYDELNTHAQCAACNVFKYGEQYAYSVNLDARYGDGTAAKLYARRFETHKFTIQELEDIIIYAKDKVKQYESNRTEAPRPYPVVKF